jgi:2-oxo-4-hydroxy-4-carboxy--5-ureidoimidazoline (OHCU) decarboxylase
VPELEARIKNTRDEELATGLKAYVDVARSRLAKLTATQ